MQGKYSKIVFAFLHCVSYDHLYVLIEVGEVIFMRSIGFCKHALPNMTKSGILANA
jgi:hypothetical protein